MTWPTKKSDKLEVRLAPDIKRDFLFRCKVAGQSASEKLRDLIECDARLLQRQTPSVHIRMVLSVAAASSLLFGVACFAGASFALSQGDIRRGLMVFMIIQSGLFTSTGIALFRAAWRWLAITLSMSALIQIVYASEVTPPAAFSGTLVGIVIGGMGPTILIALVAAIAWTLTTRREQAAFRNSLAEAEHH